MAMAESQVDDSRNGHHCACRWRPLRIAINIGFPGGAVGAAAWVERAHAGNDSDTGLKKHSHLDTPHKKTVMCRGSGLQPRTLWATSLSSQPRAEAAVYSTSAVRF
jgi:hypothetical protein